MTYRYPLPPSANRYWRYYRGRTVASEEAKEYKRTVAMLAKVDGVKQLTGPVAVTVAVHRHARPGIWTIGLKSCWTRCKGVLQE
jgi:Holliday junction resolvase RusA-like endonuclease